MHARRCDQQPDESCKDNERHHTKKHTILVDEKIASQLSTDACWESQTYLLPLPDSFLSDTCQSIKNTENSIYCFENEVQNMMQILRQRKSGTSEDKTTRHPLSSEEEEKLKARALTLKIELAKINESLNRASASESNGTTALGTISPPGKSGYLFKWQDRSIGCIVEQAD